MKPLAALLLSRSLVWKILVAVPMIATIVLLVRGRAPLQGLSAELVIVKANVITVDEKQPQAEAVAVRDGKIVAVGTTAQVKTLVGSGTQIIDAQGRTITPGFIDAHIHPRPLYPFESPHHIVDLAPERVRSIEELIGALKKKAAMTPKGHWVRGSNYQDSKLGRHPTRIDLDQVSAVHPIVIVHSSGHVSAVNTLVLQQGKVEGDTPDPPGSKFDRDKNGNATGLLFEEPAQLRSRRGSPPFPVPTEEDQVKGLQVTMRNFLAKGITSVHDASAFGVAIALYQEALAKWQPVRVTMMVRGGDRWGPSEILRDFRKVSLRGNFGNDRLRIGPVKITHGNSFSGRTCWLYEPYEGRPDYFGIAPGRSQEQLDELIFEIHQAGFRPAVHSNGDREIDQVLNAFEKALKKLPKRDARFRIEHASVTNPQILERMKDLGVIPVFHSYIYEHGDKLEEYGEKRFDRLIAVRSALDLGLHVADSSDYGVSSADPMLRIQSLVTRKSAQGKMYGARQRITVEEAIRIWTLGNAFAGFEETLKGSIEVGKLADLVMLEQDPTRVSPDALKDVKVLMTIIGGKVEH